MDFFTNFAEYNKNTSLTWTWDNNLKTFTSRYELK